MKMKLTLLVFLFIASIPLSFGSVQKNFTLEDKIDVLLEKVDFEDLETLYEIGGEKAIDVAFEKIATLSALERMPEHPFPGGEGDEREPYPFE